MTEAVEPARANGRAGSPAWLAVFDAVGLVIFAVFGAMAHDRGMSAGTVLGIVWPFAVGALLGWILVRTLSGRWAVDLGAGVTVWLLTLVVGMLLRWVTGDDAPAPSFILVATGATALLMLGWRVLVSAVVNRTR